MALDLSTLYIVAGLGMLVAGLIHAVAVASGRFGNWAAYWGAGHIAVGVGAIVTIANDQLHLAWAPRVGNPVAVIGYALITAAVMKFQRPTTQVASLLGVAALVGVPLMFSTAPQEFHVRVAYLNIVRALFDVMVVMVAVRLARREALRTGWIVAVLFAITVPLFAMRGWLAWHDRIGTSLTGRHDDLAAWLAAGQIAFIIFRAFSLLILQAERSQKALIDQMERDWLTGALNRLGLDRIVRRLAGPICVMMIDVDRFKALNDAQGHAAGDAALRRLADGAQAAIGGAGHLVRWGGDEFVALLPGMPHDRARALADAIAGGFAQAMRPHVSADIAPSVSIGLARGDAAEPFADLVARADQAMYAAKGDRRRPAAHVRAA